MKKSFVIAIILILIGVLAACSTRQSWSRNSTNGTQSNSQNPSFNAGAGQPDGNGQNTQLNLESKVGIGILKLEGTDQAVDEAKAKELLPLFKALKTLSSNNNTAVDEIRALNTQIKNTMTADQLAAIEKMELSYSDLKNLMDSYGLTSSSSSSSSSSNNGGDMMGGPGGPGGMPGMMMAAGGSSSSTKSTPNAAAAMTTARKSAGGYNLIFAEPIIKLLESKISSK